MTSPRADHRKVVGDGQICLVTRCTVKAISQHLSIMIKRRFASLLLLNLLFNGCNNQPPAPNKAEATPTPVSSPTAGSFSPPQKPISIFSPATSIAWEHSFSIDKRQHFCLIPPVA